MNARAPVRSTTDHVRSGLVQMLERRSGAFWLLTGAALTAALGVLDYRTGVALSFSLFYLAPICAGAWFGGRTVGVALALIGTAVWFVAESAGRGAAHSLALDLWNASIRLGFFVIVTLLLSELRRAFARIEELTLTDPLTGARNLRAFRESLRVERIRSRRHGRPFTLVYIDVDDFKRVNDDLGHAGGDALLRRLAEVLAGTLRGDDVLARIGGDEFALLLPETGAAEARAVSAKLDALLRHAMAGAARSVTLSVGVATLEPGDGDDDPLADPLAVADALMYEAKRSGKAQVRFNS